MEEATPVAELEDKPNDNTKEVRRTETGISVGEDVHIPSVDIKLSQWLPWPENIPLHPSIGAFGKRRTGKTTTIKNLASWAFQNIPFGVILSNTAFAGGWEDVHPKRFIFQGLREDIIQALMDRQATMIKKFGKENPVTFAYCILDDGKFCSPLALLPSCSASSTMCSLYHCHVRWLRLPLFRPNSMIELVCW